MKIEKVYWNISEVAEKINVNKSTLRFWEDEFYWFNPKRSSTGKREYNKKDVQTVAIICLLIKGFGMTSGGLRKAYILEYYKDLELIAKNNEKYYE